MIRKPDMKALKKSQAVLVELEDIGSRSEDFKKGYADQGAIIQVGSMIRKHRLALRMTQSELAKRAGMSQTDISRIESGLGVHGPTVETLARLSRALAKHLTVSLQDESATAAGQSKDLFQTADGS